MGATTTEMSHQVPHQHAMGLPTQGGGNKDSTKDSGKWGSGMTVNVEETMTYNGHHFMREPHMCCDTAKLMICPCCPFFKYTSPNESFVFSNSCLCCCQDWKVEQLTKLLRHMLPGLFRLLQLLPRQKLRPHHREDLSC